MFGEDSMKYKIGDLVQHFAIAGWTGIILDKTTRHPTDSRYNRYYVKWLTRDSSGWEFEYELEAVCESET